MRSSLRPLISFLLLCGPACIPEEYQDEMPPPASEEGRQALEGVGGRTGRQVNLRRDFNGDQNADLVWRNRDTGQLSAWLTDGNLGIIGASNSTANAEAAWNAVGIVDVNVNGRPDILWHNPKSGHVAMWLMERMTFLGDLVATRTETDANGWKPVAGGDMNRDGLADLIWHHARTGEVSFWYSLPSPNVTHHPRMRGGDGWTPFGIGDFNSDVQHDLAWFNPFTRKVRIWVMDPFGSGEVLRVEELADRPDPNWVPRTVQSMDNAGGPDIIWQHTPSRTVSVWSMTGFRVLSKRNFAVTPDPEWTIVP